MIWLLGFADIICALSLIAAMLGFPLFSVQAGAAFLLLMKAVFFIGDLLSILDIAVAIGMILLLWMHMPTLAVAIAIYTGLKGLYSFV